MNAVQTERMEMPPSNNVEIVLATLLEATMNHVTIELANVIASQMFKVSTAQLVVQILTDLATLVVSNVAAMSLAQSLSSATKVVSVCVRTSLVVTHATHAWIITMACQMPRARNARATALGQIVQSVIVKVASVLVRPASMDGSVIDVKFNTNVFQTKDVNLVQNALRNYRAE